MPLDATRLAQALKAGLLSNPATAAQDNAALSAMCQAIAVAVVTEIKLNAVVVATAMASSPGGGPITGVGIVT